MNQKPINTLKWFGLVAVALGVSFAINLAMAPAVYLPDVDGYYAAELPKDAQAQLEYFYWIWDDPVRREAAHLAMRSQNPEWDMISRSFFAYSLANVALGCPAEREKALRYLDRVIDDTVVRDWHEFLLPYGSERPFIRQPASSIMVDGEFSLMIGLRRLVADSPDYKHRALHRQMIERCVAAMEAGPVLCGECYPDECWLWCNPLALTSILR
jgi:hypothetical protein